MTTFYIFDLNSNRARCRGRFDNELAAELKCASLERKTGRTHHVSDLDLRQDELESLAYWCDYFIKQADQAGIALDDGSVIDFLAGKLEREPLTMLRRALRLAGYAHRFPNAVRATIKQRNRI